MTITFTTEAEEAAADASPDCVLPCDLKIGLEQQNLSFDPEHIARIRRKAETAEGLGPFWQGMMLGALNTIDLLRAKVDKYGLALMMIREGVAEVPSFAGEILAKAPASPALSNESFVSAVGREFKELSLGELEIVVEYGVTIPSLPLRRLIHEAARAELLRRKTMEGK